MSYDELIRDTNDLVRKVMIQNDIVVWSLSALLVTLMVLIGWMSWREHQEKMRQLRDQREWDEMQAAMNEPYYRRM
jgi:hypothetical protein